MIPAGQILSIPKILEEIGKLLEIKGENPFKARAYYNAAAILSGVDDLEALIREKKLRQIRGIGEGIAGNIEEYAATGKMGYYEELTKEVPRSLIELSGIPGLGPGKIKTIHDQLGITNAGELEYACRENRLVTLPGFGEKTQVKILQGIEFLKRHKGEFLIGDVYGEAQGIRQRLAELIRGGPVEVCGSIRRMKEIIRDIDILAAGSDHNAITSSFMSLPEVDEILVTGNTKTSCRLISGVQADLRVIDPEAFPCALVYFTGSKEHNVRLRAIAKKKGWKLNEYGLFENGRIIRTESEEEVYRLLGLAYVPPELREDTGEIEAAQQGTLPELVRQEDIRGVFHVHTTYSDGADTIERVVEAARRMGLQYIGISDHSRTAYYAGGLKADDVFRQWDVIDNMNNKMNDFHIFKGIESDILPDGSLDYDEDILKGFDFIIASVHSNFRMKKDDMEKRILKAIKNPYTTMLGHPTGRLLLSREGYEIDLKSIIDAAAKHNVIIELNASPYRLDIDWRYLKYTKQQGVMISINPDAHSSGMLAEIFYGVGIARKGWQEKKDVLNAGDVGEVAELLSGRRFRKRHA